MDVADTRASSSDEPRTMLDEKVAVEALLDAPDLCILSWLKIQRGSLEKCYKYNYNRYANNAKVEDNEEQLLID